MTAEHETQRALLEQERAQLAHRIDVLTIGGEVDMEFDDEFADRGQVAGKIGENLTIADSLEKQLALVEKALARIADGTYGSCTACGNEIGSARLEALPAADHCITHA